MNKRALGLILLFCKVLFLVSFAYADDEGSDPEDAPTTIEEDEDEFEEDDGGAPDNSDSEFVPGVSLGYPRLRGSGCRRGTRSVALSPDNRALSILFDAYQVEAGEFARAQKAKKICNMVIPVHVPKGLQATIVKLDYRGYTFVPKRGSTKFVAAYHVKDQKTGKEYGYRAKRRKVFEGPKDKDFVITSHIKKKRVWSKCGRSFDFHIDTKLVAESNHKMEDVLAVLDTVDSTISENVVFHLKWKRCQKNIPD